MDDANEHTNPSLYDSNCANLTQTLNHKGLDEIDPDHFINKELPECITNTPIYSAPYNELCHIEKGKQPFSILSFNIRSLSKNIDEFKIFLNS